MPRIVPNLWFDTQAEEAAKLYVSLFPNSRVTRTTRYGEAGKEVHGRPAGSVTIPSDLAPGVHKFVALASDGQNAGVISIPFTVGGTPPTPTPTPTATPTPTPTVTPPTCVVP